MNTIAFTCAVAVVLSLTGCQQQQAEKVIARVGDATLTEEEALRHIDTTQGNLRAQLRNYVSYWINTEIVYQEAKKEGIEDTEPFRSQIADIKRQVANQILLDKRVYDDTLQFTEEQLLQYYDGHEQEFIADEEMKKLNIALFDTREKANTFAALLSKGFAWQLAVDKVRAGGSETESMLSVTSDKYFTQQTLYPSELWKVAAALNINQISFPVKTAIGYAIIQTVDNVAKGSRLPFVMARDRIRQRMHAEQRREAYADFLGNLRQRYNVEMLLSQDTTDGFEKVHE